MAVILSLICMLIGIVMVFALGASLGLSLTLAAVISYLGADETSCIFQKERLHRDEDMIIKWWFKLIKAAFT